LPGWSGIPKIICEEFLMNLATFIPHVKETSSKQSFGHAMSLSSNSCRIEVSRNDCNTAICSRTYYTFRWSHSTSRVLQMKPASICLGRSTHIIRRCGLPRILA
jgi:hypothetical protein